MKNRVEQSDRTRAIVTDLIPYEVPVRFSFMHVHQLLKRNVKNHGWIERLFEKQECPKALLPYSYSIKRNDGRRRKLSLMHPLLLKNAADLYSKFSGAIISLCGKSVWSLRRPCRPASVYFTLEDDLLLASVNEEVGIDDDGDHQEVGISAESQKMFQDYASSFFVYEPFSLLERFFNSKDILNLERKFGFCRRFDIAKCFDNIYSHSVSWAIKGKRFAKQELGCKQTLDAQLDAIMYRSNNLETHGILIGSELSRIFAEIILQEIDVRAQERLLLASCDRGDGPNLPVELVDGRDYTVRRYIDDYFVFYNDVKVADAVQSAIEWELSLYKLFLNENKTTDEKRPFITGISIARGEIRKLIAGYFFIGPAECASAVGGGSGQRSGRFSAPKLLCEMRMVLSRLNVSIAEVSASVLKQLGSAATRQLTSFKGDETRSIEAKAWICCVVEVAFYVFSSDIRFRTAVLVGRLVDQLASALPGLADRFAGDIEDLILRESIGLLKQVRETRDVNRLEIASFLICLTSVPGYWRIPEPLIREVSLQQWNSTPTLDYFAMVSFLYFMGDRKEYSDLRRELVVIGVDRILRTHDLLRETELFCLSLDLLSCPWVDRDSKRKIAFKLIFTLNSSNPSASDVDGFVKQFSRRTWFFDWRASVANSLYLRKKELSLSY